MTDHEEIEAGRKARDALETVVPYFARLEAGMMDRWLTSGVEETQVREKLFFAMQSLKAVRDALMAAVDAGEAANIRIILSQNGLQR